MNAMAHRLRFHSAVPVDLVVALDYYKDVSPKLANRFRDIVDKRLDEIAAHPELFPVDVSPIRFAKIDRFPYSIFSFRRPNSYPSSQLFTAHPIPPNGEAVNDFRHTTRICSKARSGQPSLRPRHACC
jgi:hypothetical protein